ncbi:MAG: UDP-N-acetylglucosamine--N-acetylmuramyl-(pentapeptide) pyrophosphoryl-undecaprenol N-acetylglucosamine transferase [Planctomycetota bacterium]
MEKNKILLVCGGSGGHIFPSIAMAEYLINKNIDCYFLVSRKNIDIKIMEKFPFPYATIPHISQRSDYLFFLYNHYKNVKTLFSHLQPSVVISTGSIYSFVPLLFFFLQKGIKIFLFEPNTIPGRVNSFFFRWCENVFTGWKYDYSATFFGAKTIISGIPIRNGVKKVYERKMVLQELNLQPHRKTVLITGGSQGSLFLNTSIVKILVQSELSKEIQIALLTSDRFSGDNFLSQENIRILPFTIDVGKFYSIADLVITRGGAMTLAEVCYRQLPNISIPYPGSANNHQLINSKFLQEKGLTFCLEESDFKESVFIEICKKFLFNDNLISNIKMNMRSFFIDNAETTIYETISKYL